MRRLTLSLAVAAALCVQAVLSPIASASPAHPTVRPSSRHVAGSGSGLSTTTLGSRQLSSRTLTHASSDVLFIGDIAATGVEVYTIATGRSKVSRLYGYGAFAGTIAGRWGTFAYQFTGISTASGLRGVIRIDSGMDGLSGVRGVIRWQGAGSSFTYNGDVRFLRHRHPGDPSAARQVQVAGSGAGTSATTLDSRQVGSQTLTHVISGVELTGDIAATGTEVLTVVADASTRAVAFRGYGILAGTVADRWGLFRYHFTGAAGTSGVSGEIVFVSGMEALHSLRGAVEWEGPGATFNYDGTVRIASAPNRP